MTIAKKLKKFLKESGVEYEVLKHQKAYTAQEIAARSHIPGKMLAKTVILKLNGNFALAVLPATYTISFKQFAKTVGLKKVELASEDEFQKLFTDCETGAMPPFGNLYDLPTYVSSDLKANKEIVFNAGSHVKLIKMKFSDYEKLVKPTIAHFELH